MDNLTWWFFVVVFIFLQFVWTLIIRFFPKVLGAAFVKRIQHGYDLKLEKTKAELQANYSTLETSVGYLTTTQSELRSKIIESVETLWNAVLTVKKKLGDAALLDSFLLSQEINEVFRTQNSQFIQVIKHYRDNDYLENMVHNKEFNVAEKVRPFVGDRLWMLFFYIRAVHGRIIHLVHQSFVKKQYFDWRNDDHFGTLLESVLPKGVIEKAKNKKIGGFQFIVSHLEAEFLKESARVMSGSRGLADSLPDTQSTLQYGLQLVREHSEKHADAGRNSKDD